MASAKSSRSRASAPSGLMTPNGLATNGVSSESGVQLADMLKIFKADNFDPDAYVQSKCQAMSEKEIRHLCSHFQDLKRASTEEMRRSVYANYAAFIRLLNRSIIKEPMLGIYTQVLLGSFKVSGEASCWQLISSNQVLI